MQNLNGLGAWQAEGSARMLSQRDIAEGWREVVWEVGETPGSAVLTLELGSVTNPFWCIPGLFWGDNLQDTTPALYPRFDRAAETPANFRSRRWMVSLNRISQPLVAVHDGRTWRALEVDPGVSPHEAGNFSLGFAWSPEATQLRLRLPECDEPYLNSGCEQTGAVSRNWLPGSGPITVRYRCFAWEGKAIDLRDHLRKRYRDLVKTAPGLWPEPPEPADAAAAAAEGLCRWHYSPENKTFKYTVAYDRVGQQIAETAGTSLDSLQFFVGWVNGWVVMEPLLDFARTTGDAEAVRTVNEAWLQVADGIVSPSGFWWARHAPEFVTRGGDVTKTIFQSRLSGGFDGGWMADPYHLHLRTVGDGVLRAARALGKHADRLSFAGDLRRDVVRQAGLAADLMTPDGEIPVVVDARTGRPTGQGGTAGMIWISVWLELMRQGEWEGRPAIEQAAGFARRAVASGILYGAPEDVGECMTSEDVYIAINCFCDLYEAFGQDEDLAAAVSAASWLPFYRRCFHVPLPARSLLAQYGLNAIGGDIASIKNCHLHIYGLDADHSLHRLSQWTGDPCWRQMAADHWRYAIQALCLEDGHFNGYRGLVPEQPYFINWTCLGNSVHHQEGGPSRSVWTVDRYFRNGGNMAGFSNAWCVAFVLSAALRRMTDPGEIAS